MRSLLLDRGNLCAMAVDIAWHATPCMTAESQYVHWPKKDLTLNSLYAQTVHWRQPFIFSLCSSSGTRS